MIKEIYPYIIVALIGSFVNILAKLAGLEKLSEIFSLKIWIEKNKYTTCYGVVVTILTIIILWSTKELSWASAILAGYAGDSLMKTKLPGGGSISDEKKPIEEVKDEPEINTDY